MVSNLFKRDNGRDHRAAAIDIVFKSRAARGSVCIVLLSGRSSYWRGVRPRVHCCFAHGANQVTGKIARVPID